MVYVLAAGEKNVTASAIRKLFYNDPKEGDGDRVGPGARRTARFLTALDDAAYRELYEFLIENPSFRLPDVHSLLETPKDVCQTMMEVMIHVVLWIDRDSEVVADKRKANKLPLRKGFIKRLQNGTDEKAMRLADKRSIMLEREILDFVRRRQQSLTHPVTKGYLKAMPDPNDRNGAVYAERFVDRFWQNLLHIVETSLGPKFRPWWVASKGGDGLGLSPANSLKGCSAVTRAVCALVSRVPEVAENPALNSKEASGQLAAAIDGCIVKWVADRCRQALRDDQNGPSQNKLADADRVIIESTGKEYNLLMLKRSQETKTNEPGPTMDAPSRESAVDDPTVRTMSVAANVPSEHGASGDQEVRSDDGGEESQNGPDQVSVAETEKQRESQANEKGQPLRARDGPDDGKDARRRQPKPTQTDVGSSQSEPSSSRNPLPFSPMPARKSGWRGRLAAS